MVAYLSNFQPSFFDPQSLRTQAEMIWRAGVKAVDPARLVREEIEKNEELSSALSSCRRVILLGAGKAASSMVRGALAGISEQKEVIGLVHVIQGEEGFPREGLELLSVREPAINFPTFTGVAGAKRQLELAKHAKSGDLGLVLISGGASAMLPLPAGDLTLEDKLFATRLLHSIGMPIESMNTVRKHLSGIKGGSLRKAWGGRDSHFPSLWTLAISDVVGDSPAVIGSGPTVADTTTPSDAIYTVNQYGLAAAMPSSIMQHLSCQTLFESSQPSIGFEKEYSKYCLIGSNRKAALASLREAELLGWRTLDLGSSWDFDSSAMAGWFAGLTRNIYRDRAAGGPPLCLIAGGETVQQVPKDSGKGGRNQHLALLMNDSLKSFSWTEFTWLIAGTDGEDGPTDAAGGFVDFLAIKKQLETGIDWGQAIRTCASNGALHNTGALFVPGPTGTNVADLWIGLFSG